MEQYPRVLAYCPSLVVLDNNNVPYRLELEIEDFLDNADIAKILSTKFKTSGQLLQSVGSQQTGPIRVNKIELMSTIPEDSLLLNHELCLSQS